jgi:hypothetical protein
VPHLFEGYLAPSHRDGIVTSSSFYVRRARRAVGAGDWGGVIPQEVPGAYNRKVRICERAALFGVCGLDFDLKGRVETSRVVRKLEKSRRCRPRTAKGARRHGLNLSGR